MQIRWSFLLVLSLSVASTYRCTNRLYKGQRLKFGEHLCSRSLAYRLFLNGTGAVVINEAYARVMFYLPPPSTLFATGNPQLIPKHLEFTDSGDLVAVASDGSIYWRANVTGGDFVELQNNGVAVIFRINATGPQVLWKSPSMYSLRLVGGINQGRLEVFYNNTWGGVSTTGFADVDAGVACRTLGYQSGSIITNSFGSNTARVWLSQVMCRGKENVFQECAFGESGTTWGDSSWASLPNVAVQCTGNWTTGVMSPSAHVCVDRLYVGQTLFLEDSLCAGPNGEYALRITNQHGDTIIRLEYQGQYKWMLGMTANTSSGLQLQLGSDGLLRFVGNGMAVNISGQTLSNSDYLELQDNGMLRVAGLKGSTGWTKSPNDYCYDVRQAFSLMIKNYMLLSTAPSSSLLTCLESCANTATCKTAEYTENIEPTSAPTTTAYNAGVMCGTPGIACCAAGTSGPSCCSPGGPCCIQKNVGPWDSFLARNYYEKLPNCTSGASCYNAYTDIINIDFDLTAGSTSLASCMADCDANPKCTNILIVNPGSSQTCGMKYKRRNESWINIPSDAYFKRTNCSSGDSSVTLLPAKTCKMELNVGDYLLPGEQLCSLNNQHAVTVGRDGKISLDRGTWNSANANGRTAFLQLTSANQLVLRMDDGSTKWQFGAHSDTSDAPGRVIVSNDGQLQIVDSFGNLVWDNFRGLKSSVRFVVGISQQAASSLIDGKNTTCMPGVSLAAISINEVIQSTNLSVNVVGSQLQCDPSGYSVTILRERDGIDLMDVAWRYKPCSLISIESSTCRYLCNCDVSRCGTVVVSPNTCSAVPVDLCDVIIN